MPTQVYHFYDNAHLETGVDHLVKGFGCTLASMPANQHRVAFVRGPENLMLELIEA